MTMQNRNTDNHNAHEDDDFLRPLQGLQRAAPGPDLFAAIENRLAEPTPARAPLLRLRWDLVAAACLLIVNVYLFNRAPQQDRTYAHHNPPRHAHAAAPATPYEQIQLTTDFTLYE